MQQAPPVAGQPCRHQGLPGDAPPPRRGPCCVQLLEYGQCYLGHPYTRTITLVNQSPLPAKYEVLQQVRPQMRCAPGLALASDLLCVLLR